MKIFISLVCAIWSIGLLTAQEGQTRLGFQISPTISWLSSDDNLINGNAVKLGMKLGAVGDHYVKDWLIWHSSFGYGLSQGGTLLHKVGGNLLPKSELSDPQYNRGEKPLPDNVDITYTLQTFEIETGLKYLIPVSSANLDILAAFPLFNLSIISKVKGNVQATGVNLSNENLGKDVNPFNFSWGFGLGIQRPTAGGQEMMLGLYYQKGLADLTRDDGTQVGTNPNGTFTSRLEDSKGTLNALIFKFALLF